MARRRKRGRPSKLTPETTVPLLKAISLGATYELACQYAGIDYSTLCRWQAIHVKDPTREPFARFCDALKKAEGEGAVGWLFAVNKGGFGWQASAWMLERRYPNVYGRFQKVQAESKTEHKQIDEKNVNVNVQTTPGVTGQDAVDIVKILRDVGAIKDEHLPRIPRTVAGSLPGSDRPTSADIPDAPSSPPTGGDAGGSDLSAGGA